MNITHLTAGSSGSNASSYVTDSIAPAPGTILLMAIETDIGAGTPGIPEVSGLGANWAIYEDCYFDHTGTTYRLTVYVGQIVIYTPGVVTISYDGVAQGGCSWVIDQAHVTHSSGLIVQAFASSEPGPSATSITTGLSTPPSEGNVVWAAVSWVAQESATVEPDWTILGQTNHANPAASLVTLYNDKLDDSVVVSWTTSAPKGSVVLEILGVIPTELHSSQDDWSLRANGDTERSEGSQFTFDYYLVDTAGNNLTDTAGNRLIGRSMETVYPQILHSTQDDWNLNAE